MSLVVNNLPANTGDIRDTGSIPRSGRSPGEGHGNPLQYSSLENAMDRGAWQATVHGVAKSRTWLKQLSTHYRAEASQLFLHYPLGFPHLLRFSHIQSFHLVTSWNEQIPGWPPNISRKHGPDLGPRVLIVLVYDTCEIGVTCSQNVFQLYPCIGFSISKNRGTFWSHFSKGGKKDNSRRKWRLQI